MRGAFEKAIVGALVVLSAWGVTGCYKDIRDYCEELVDCEGGNDDDVDACVDRTKGERNAAKELDCKDDFDEMLECFVDEMDCESYYGESYLVAEGCEDEQDDYYDCID